MTTALTIDDRRLSISNMEKTLSPSGFTKADVVH